MLPQRRLEKVGSACVQTLMIVENEATCDRNGMTLTDMVCSQPFSYLATRCLTLSTRDVLVWTLDVLSANRISRSSGDSCMIFLLRARPHGESFSTTWTSTNVLVKDAMSILGSWYL